MTSSCGPVKGILEIGKWEDDASSFNPDGKCLISNAWGPGYVPLLRKKSPSLKCGVGSVPGDSCTLARNFCKVPFNVPMELVVIEENVGVHLNFFASSESLDGRTIGKGN